MIRRLSLAVIVSLLSISSLYAQHTKLRLAHIGHVYPLSTNGFDAREYTNVFSLHGIVGVSKAEKSFCAAGFSNVVYDYADGVIMAGFSNHILGDANGLQAAGFMNTVHNDSRGIQAAGFMNITGSLNGFQCAGFCNITGYDVRGFQSAGFCNIASSNIKGVQAAGFMNLAGDVNGTQVSGFMNKSGDVRVQVGGFINMAKKVSGAQVSGFINIADSSDYPIGIVNIVKNGEKALGFTIEESGTSMVTFRSGGRIMYGILGAGYKFRSSNDLYVLEAGIGAHLLRSGAFRLNIEGSTQAMADIWVGEYLKSSVRILPSVLIANRVEVFAGPTINHVQSEEFDGGDISTHYLWTNTNRGSFNGIYIGAIAGLQFHF